jgi:glycosyltransferase involved in cell wall biosynthesis
MQTVIQIDQKEWIMSRANVEFRVQKQICFQYTGAENYYRSLSRLFGQLPKTEGALILNYGMEMAMLDHFPTQLTTYQLVHDSYNVGLAKKYGHLTDVFICHNTSILRDLQSLFPDRINRIFYLPHGVHIPSYSRKSSEPGRPIKLIFIGRMTESKGIFDLPVIDRLLKAKGVPVEWVCIGNGPELNTLKSVWGENSALFLSPDTNEEVLQIASECDLFVLPTRFEGSPVSLLEAMSVGLVPLISDLPGGIQDIVNEQIGYRIKTSDNELFANFIESLNANRLLLENLSKNCRNEAASRFNILHTSTAYHALFRDFKSFYRPKKIRKQKVGARLDQPWLPDFVTRWVRRLRN